MSQVLRRLVRPARALARQPLLNGAVVTILALGIGANALMFMVMDHFVLRPLPLEDLDRKVVLWESQPARGVERSAVSAPNFLDVHERSAAFEALAAVRRGHFSLRTEIGFEQARGAYVTEDFFEVFPVRPVVGETFGAADVADLGEDVVVISHRLWQQRFAADRQIVGRHLEVDGRSRVVLGVLDPELDFPTGSDVWLPLVLHPEPAERGLRHLLAVGSLAPGVTLASVSEDVKRLSAQLRQEFPAANADADMFVTSLRSELVSGYRATVTLLWAAFGVILVIVGVNVASVLLVRAAARDRELALAIALGASRRQVIRQLGEEILILGLSAAGLGLAFAEVGRRLLIGANHGLLPRMESLALDPRVVLVTLAIALATTVFIGLLPAGQYLRVGLNALAGESFRSRSRGRRVVRLQSWLVVTQLAVSLPLLVTAILLWRNLGRLQQVDVGFESAGVLTVGTTAPRRDGADARRRIEALDAALERVRALPWIQAAGGISDLPMSGSGVTGSFIIENHETGHSAPPTAGQRVITPGYFSVMRIPLVAGRRFDERDGAFGEPVAIINERLARRYWPAGDALGQRIRIGAPEEVEVFGGSVAREIVGIVGDVLHQGFGSEWEGEIFLPYAQFPTHRMTVAVLVDGPPLAAAPDVRAALASARDEFLVGSVRPMSEVVSQSLGYPAIQTWLIGFLGMLSLLLVSMSVYAIVAHFLELNRNSIGVRIALGAGPGRVARLVLREGALVCCTGLGVGLMISWAVVRAVTSWIYVLEPSDPLAFAAASGVLLAIATIAGLVPTRRLLKSEPGWLLRHE